MIEEILKIVEETPVLGVKTKLKLISYLKENHLSDERLSGILKSFQEANTKYEEIIKEEGPKRLEAIKENKEKLDRIAHEVLLKKLHKEEEAGKEKDEKEEDDLLKQL